MPIRIRNRRKQKKNALALAAKVAGGVAAAAAAGLTLKKRLAGGRPEPAGQGTTFGAGNPYDDVTLARKVESEIFRDAGAPKGSVDVNAENGVVFLRGQVDREDQIETLASAARSVDGVKAVESLLHTPGTPAPMKS